MADKFQLKALITGVDKLSPTLAGIRKNVSSFQKGLEKTGLGKIGFRDLIAGGAIAAPFVAGINKAIEFESQMADVKKVVDFDTPEQFKKMGDDIGRMSERLPMAASDIAKIVAAGGQSGIAKDELLGFAEAAVKMGVAFDQTADESGDMMAKWRTAFKMSQADVVALADQINYLGNTGPASTKQISSIITEVGALGEVAGLSSAQVAAIGATMAGVGVKQDVAATGIKNFMLAMTKGSAATKSQAEAFKALRLDSKQVAQAMQKDSRGTMLDLLKRISEVDDAKRPALLTNLFGSESIAAITPLITNLDLLKGNLTKVGDATQYAGSMDKEYASRAATTENNMQLLRNTIGSVGRALGNALLPGVNMVIDSLRPMISHVAELVAANPNLVRGLTIAGAAFTAIRVAVLAATVATRLMGVAFAATPVGLIAVGIAAAAGLIVANWDKVGPFFTALWDLIKAYTVPAWEIFKAFAAWTPLGL
ncbi:phage tail tape measure protein, partial [Pseudomonas asiatica]|uniref:phage tail tape measure protein n=1 Tax=Pseudomonas asiatica TaxID=2219225 RepID=UPI002E7B489C